MSGICHNSRHLQTDKKVSGSEMLYHCFADKKPVMLFDIQEQRIYAYPYEEFKAELSERSQTILAEQYEQALENQKIVIFVRDNVKRKLVSYTIAAEDTEANQGVA